MAKIQMEEQKDFAILPQDSIVHLKIDKCDVVEVQGNRGPWEKVEIAFKILGIQATGDGSPVTDYEDLITTTIYGSVPFRFTTSPENKLRLWTEAILNMPLGLGFELDTDMFVGREVRGITRTYEKRKTDAQGKPFIGQAVESLLPLSGGAPPQQQQPQGQGQWGQQPAGSGTWGQSAQQSRPLDPWSAQQATAAPVADPWGAGDEPPF